MVRVPAQIVPLSPRTMWRTPGIPLAQISTLNPGGTFRFEIGISDSAVTVIFPACGARGDVACASDIPCFQPGTPCGRSGLAAFESVGAAPASGAEDRCVIWEQPTAARQR